MFKYFKIFPLIIICWGVDFLVGSKVLAANLFFQASQQEIKSESLWEVSFWLDTQGGTINALEGSIVFPTEQLEVVDLKVGDSLVNFWLENPQVISPGQLKFSGIVPGGYLGRGQLFKIIFKAKLEGANFLICQQPQVLLNDGQGTATLVTSQDFPFAISPDFPAGEVSNLESLDFEPPESFEPLVTKIPEIGGDNFLLVFTTQDKLSGIDYYEVKEGRRAFVRATSPYLLQNQKLNQSIIIRAIDRTGNIREENMPAINKLAWYARGEIFAIIIGVIVFLGLAGRVLWRKKKQK